MIKIISIWTLYIPDGGYSEFVLNETCDTFEECDKIFIEKFNRWYTYNFVYTYTEDIETEEYDEIEETCERIKKKVTKTSGERKFKSMTEIIQFFTKECPDGEKYKCLCNEVIKLNEQ